MDSGVLILGAVAYCAVAIWLVVLGAKGSKPGLARIFKEVDQRSLEQNRDGRELAV